MTKADGRWLHIAAGVVRRPSGEVLICQRPPHKLYPGQWEFPGGKVEAGEDVETALRRELHEELGIEVSAASPLIRVRYRYPELAVELDAWRVEAHRGEVRSTEHPAIAWVAADELPRWSLLAADRPIVNALRLPRDLVFTPPTASHDELQAGIATLPRGAFVRLRQPALADTDYVRLVQALMPVAHQRGVTIVVDRAPSLVPTASAWHATSAMLRTLSVRPVGLDVWFGASCHTAEDLARASALGADFAVLGAVRRTATHPDGPALGWETFAALARDAGVPVYAIGGVGPADLPEARRHGAHGVAGISAYWRVGGSSLGSSSESEGIV